MTTEQRVTDHGILALVLAAEHFDKSVSARSLQHKLGLKAGSADELDLCRCAAWVGVKARIETVQLDRLENLPMPALTKINGEYCLMLASQGEQVLLQHPVSKKKKSLSKIQWAQLTAQHIILLADKAVAKKQLEFGFSWFIPSILKHIKQAKSVLLVSLFIQLIALVTPLLFENVIDKVLVSRSLSSLQVLAIAMMALALFEPIFSYLRGWLFSNLAGKLTAELNSRLYRHLLALPMSFFNQRQTGQITARVREMDKIRQFLSGSALSMLLDLLFIFVFIAVLFAYAPKLTWLVLGSLLLYFLFWLCVGPTLRARVNTHFECSADNSAFLNQAITGVETIKTSAVEAGFIKQWQTNLAMQLKAGFKARITSILAQQGISLIQKVTAALLLWWGVKLVLSGDLTAGELVAFNMLAGQVTQPILRLAQVWQDFQHTLISLSRIGDILSEPTEAGAEGLASNPEVNGEISFKQVRFRYQSDSPEVISNLSFEIKSGEFIGITGSSGSGKSTVTKLLQRLYSPNSGEVTIDGLDLAIADPVELRRSMSIVLQESHLFSGSVSDNIRQCLPQASEEQVINAAKLAGAHQFIEQLAQGYNTQIGERGGSLSGGQKQRLALARALITNPKILVLDEATSALDYESEAAIISRLPEITKGRTVISIAHRLNTIRHCDRILVIESGQISESGSHQSLLEQKEKYARLWASQVG
ncbi:MAG: ATP-binding cassette subfamily B protein RtxE [Psychromonas sp.]|jgi:ATP-binding cassette subfamily B protein RtxE|uniref:type I secretion system permease/ATPase n=1 Tax=Psychromonas sp. TaxID=1884585 RepID=UPI0039E4D2CF